jgi:hypothetical protein
LLLISQVQQLIEKARIGCFMAVVDLCSVVKEYPDLFSFVLLHALFPRPQLCGPTITEVSSQLGSKKLHSLFLLVREDIVTTYSDVWGITKDNVRLSDVTIYSRRQLFRMARPITQKRWIVDRLADQLAPYGLKLIEVDAL